jgi:hypothetical protein
VISAECGGGGQSTGRCEPAPGAIGQIHAALFGDRPAATVPPASGGADVLGFASCSFLRPAAGADTSLVFYRVLSSPVLTCRAQP